MISANEVEKALKEMDDVKKKYPSFFKLFMMIQDMNFNLALLQKSMEKGGKNGKSENSKKR